jgi:tripartite-type tricarboxylate transporter receptor subunit TctC
LKAFAILGPKRHSVLTDVPTVDEVAGLKGMYYPVWQGLFVSSKVPKSIAVDINKAVNAVVQSPAYQEWLTQRGSSVEGGLTADQADAYFKEESRKLEAMAAQIGFPRE